MSYPIEAIGGLFDTGELPPLPIDPSWILPPGYEHKPDGSVGPIAPPSSSSSSGPSIELLIGVGAGVVAIGVIAVLLLRR